MGSQRTPRQPGSSDSDDDPDDLVDEDYGPYYRMGPAATAPRRDDAVPHRFRNGFGMTALILGILDVVGWFDTVWTPSTDEEAGLLLLTLSAVLTVIFGHCGLMAVRQGVADNPGGTVTGLVLGYLVLGYAMVNLVAPV